MATTPTNEEVQLRLPTLRQGMNVQQWSVLGLQRATGAFAGRVRKYSTGATASGSVKLVQHPPACLSYWNINFFVIFILDEPGSNGKRQVGKG